MATDDRLPARVEVQALIRLAQAESGFAAVVHRGEETAGGIVLLTMTNGANATLWERVPQRDGSRKWSPVLYQDIENKDKISQTIDRRIGSDPDLWIVELDIADPERFIGLTSL